MGFGSLHPCVSAEELPSHVRLQLKAHFFRVLKRCTLKEPLPVPRSHAREHQWHLADREPTNKEARPGVHWNAVEEFTTKHATVLVTRPPCQPPTSVLMPALASQLSVLRIPCAWNFPFSCSPSHHHWTKNNCTVQQLFGNTLLHCYRMVCEPMPILINFIHKTWIYSMQFFGTLSNTTQNYISVIRGKD